VSEDTLTGTLKGNASCHCSSDAYSDGWDRIFGTEEDWTENFITKEGAEFVCWDETQSHVIGTASTRYDAIRLVENYAEYLAAIGLDVLEIAGEED